jgi:hypothetical protein
MTSPWSPRPDAAHIRMTAFVSYARKIGCTILPDAIIADEAQCAKLADWWSEHL